MSLKATVKVAFFDFFRGFMKKLLLVLFGLLMAICLVSCASKDVAEESEIPETDALEEPVITDAAILTTARSTSFTDNEEAAELYYEAYDAIMAGDFEKAEILLRQALELDPEFVDAMSNLGIVLRRLGKTDEAIEVLKKCISLNPYNSTPYNSLCIAYMDKRDYKNALKTCQDEIKVLPDEGEAYYNEASVYMNTREFKNAVQSYKKAIMLLKDKDEERMYDAVYSIGFCFYTLQDWKNAVSYMEMAIEHFPDDQDLKDFLESARDWKELSY